MFLEPFQGGDLDLDLDRDLDRDRGRDLLSLFLLLLVVVELRVERVMVALVRVEKLRVLGKLERLCKFET